MNSSGTKETLLQPKKTSLYDTHVRLGGKMVEFGGFLMPVQYKGIIEEHRCVRTRVGLFDVSHMGEFRFTGSDALAFIQRMTLNDASKLEVGQAQYTGMCYEHGGMVDDLLVYRLADGYMMVVNASNIDKDFEWLAEHKQGHVELSNISDETALLALQGRYAEPTLQKLTDVDLSQIRFYHFTDGEVAGVKAMISRTGYTGEDGFEIGFDASQAETVWNAILEAGEEFGIQPIGLGARDTLRLEMKYCLYGNDIDETTTPLEAGLGWIVKFDKGEFVGREALLKQKEAGLRRKLVGFEVNSRAVPRHDYAILKDGESVGRVTSGTFSPMLEKPIGLGYVRIEHTAVGTELEIDIRGRHAPAKVVKTPFYKRDY
jgi:aminomethyltransferase